MFVGLKHVCERCHYVCSPILSKECLLAIPCGICVAAGHPVATIPDGTRKGCLCVHKLHSHAHKPWLEFLSFVNKLIYKIVVTIYPFLLVVAQTKTSIICLEDMQVRSREKQKLILFHAFLYFRFCIGKICSYLFLQVAEDRKKFLMNAML